MIRRGWQRLRRFLTLRRIGKWTMGLLIATLLVLLAPVVYVEVACRGSGVPHVNKPLIIDPAFQRTATNTYLTYPEWHIVFAYDGLAHTLRTGDEHAFPFLRSIDGFWRSTCTLMRVAGEHGGAERDTRMMIHTIGVSFTAEMLAKALYEETIGHVTAWVRGPRKTPQDLVIASMAIDYAAFLRQTPWYRYPFDQKAHELWNAPMDQIIRGWERRLGIGFEFEAKRVYAKVIGRAVAATGEAQLVIRSVVDGIDPATLARMPDVKVIAVRGADVEIETPRYDIFTRLLAEIARRGGHIREIAGNDEIMVTMTVPEAQRDTVSHGTVMLRMKRDGIPGDRLLVAVKVTDLAAFLNAHPLGDPGLEHVFDY